MSKYIYKCSACVGLLISIILYIYVLFSFVYIFDKLLFKEYTWIWYIEGVLILIVLIRYIFLWLTQRKNNKTIDKDINLNLNYHKNVLRNTKNHNLKKLYLRIIISSLFETTFLMFVVSFLKNLGFLFINNKNLDSYEYIIVFIILTSLFSFTNLFSKKKCIKKFKSSFLRQII